MDVKSRGGYTTCEEVLDTIRRRIEGGDYALGRPLPSERSLAEELSVNRRTLRRALEMLQRQGMLEPRGGRGGHVPVGGPRTNPIGFCLDLSLPEETTVTEASLVPTMLAQGVSRRLGAAKDGRTLVWCKQGADGQLDSGTVSAVDGLIIWPTLPAAQEFTTALRLLRSKVPVVLLDRRIPGFESDFVGYDDRGVGRAMAEHLLSLGHRSFAFFGWGIPETVHERLRGAMDTIREGSAELAWDHIYLSAEDGTVASKFDDFLRRADRPTALLCANDMIAIALIMRLRDEGYSVPGDFAVVGVGNNLDQTLDAVGLTTVSLPTEDLGWEAADLLLSRLQGDRQDAFISERRLPARLIIRRSCGVTSSRKPVPSGENANEKT